VRERERDVAENENIPDLEISEKTLKSKKSFFASKMIKIVCLFVCRYLKNGSQGRKIERSFRDFRSYNYLMKVKRL